jgi:hypothetical protein
MRTEAFDPHDHARLVEVQAALITQLSPGDLERYLRVEPGSTRMHPLGDGWWSLTAGIADVVELGQFHISVLRADAGMPN